ncbi:hypothetical protein H5410_019775 [Solanum commersonii]|uniref:Uncharacterized protein n=1 Tax=Solanum commersonii TaxID=4109 RepID=A0A9J5ZC71_SOLCO|nr:hypothetical protein H5410_019775 [Solanum commersonii]
MISLKSFFIHHFHHNFQKSTTKNCVAHRVDTYKRNKMKERNQQMQRELRFTAEICSQVIGNEHEQKHQIQILMSSMREKVARIITTTMLATTTTTYSRVIPQMRSGNIRKPYPLPWEVEVVFNRLSAQEKTYQIRY